MKIQGDHPIKINEKLTLSFKVKKDLDDERTKDQILQMLISSYQELIEKQILDKNC